MKRFTKLASLTLFVALMSGILANSASAQIVTSYYAPQPVIVNSPPPYVPAVSYYQPAPAPTTVTYYPPQQTVTYYQAPTTVTYYQPAPVVSYYQPAPVTVYSPPPATTVLVPAPTYVTTPGTVTTRTYVGLGVFRPFGVNRDVYYSPGRTYVYP